VTTEVTDMEQWLVPNMEGLMVSKMGRFGMARELKTWEFEGIKGFGVAGCSSIKNLHRLLKSSLLCS